MIPGPAVRAFGFRTLHDRASRHHERQNGAVMVLALAMLGAAVLAWQHRASLTQLIMVQQSLDQATAAGALGAAQLHARILNAHALLNRTEMAHQVAMAHIMTVASARQLRQNLGASARLNNPPVSLIGMFFGSAHRRAYADAARDIDRGSIDELRRAFERHDRLLNGRLKRARRGLTRDVARRTKELVREIVRRNLSRHLAASPVILVDVRQAAGLAGRVKRMQSEQRWQGWLDAVMDRHAYLADRNHTRFALSPMLPMCPLHRHLLMRRGESVISVDGQWSAEDTISFHSARYNHLIKCHFREYPMGWSNLSVKPVRPGVDAADQESEEPAIVVPKSFKNNPYWKWATAIGGLVLNVFFPHDNRLGALIALPQKIQWQRHSMPVPYELDVNPAKAKVTVLTRIPVSSLHSRSWKLRLDQPGLVSARHSMWPRFLKGQAAATVHYDRLAEPAEKTIEQPNLFQAFWNAHEVPVR